MIHVKHTHVMRCSHIKKNGSCQNCTKVGAMVLCIRNSKWVFQKFKINRREETQVQIYKYTLLCIFLCLALLGVGDMGVGGGSICCTVGARSFLSDRFSWTLAMFQCGNAGTMNFVVWRKSTIRGPRITCCVEESMQMPLWYPYIAGWCAGGWYEESDMTPPVGVDGTEYWLFGKVYSFFTM